LLGVLGVIGGQIINAWREDRRWKREQHREDLRWQRQKLSENARLHVEHAHQWRETKIRIYGELISRLQKYVSLMTASVVLPAAETSADVVEAELNGLAKELQGLTREIAKTIGEVTLIGSAELVEQLSGIRKSLGAFVMVRERHTLLDDGFKDEMLSLVKESQTSIDAIRDIARSELAVSKIEIGDKAQEAPWTAH
jgi:hypothetical protein